MNHSDSWPTPLAMPVAWLSPPEHMVEATKRGEPTHLVVTQEGRVFGHVATFATPMTRPDGSKFWLPRDLDLNDTMQGHHVTAEGINAAVGVLMTDRSHTDVTLPLDIARDKFGHVGNQFAQVHFGYDSVGLYAAGAITPGVPAASVVAARGGSLSGEWFPVLASNGEWFGQFEFLGAQVVNVPGFSLPQRADRSRYAIAAARPGAFLAGLGHDDPPLGVVAYADSSVLNTTSKRRVVVKKKAAAPSSGSERKVVKGDSLWKIAEKTLGDGKRWKEIYAANKDVIGSNPDLIKPGQKLKMPGTAKSPAAKKPATKKPATKTEVNGNGETRPTETKVPSTRTGSTKSRDRAASLKQITAETRAKRESIMADFAAQLETARKGPSTPGQSKTATIYAARKAALAALREENAQKKAALKGVTAAEGPTPMDIKAGTKVTLDDGTEATVVSVAKMDGEDVAILDDGTVVFTDEIDDAEEDAEEDSGDVPEGVTSAGEMDGESDSAPGDMSAAQESVPGTEMMASIADGLASALEMLQRLVDAQPVAAAAVGEADAASLAAADAL